MFLFPFFFLHYFLSASPLVYLSFTFYRYPFFLFILFLFISITEWQYLIIFIYSFNLLFTCSCHFHFFISLVIFCLIFKRLFFNFFYFISFIFVCFLCHCLFLVFLYLFWRLFHHLHLDTLSLQSFISTSVFFQIFCLSIDKFFSVHRHISKK